MLVVAEALLARHDLAGADAFERRERPARVRRDPHVDHRGGLELHQTRSGTCRRVGEAGDSGLLRVGREAEVVVDVPLHQRAADVGHVLERDDRRAACTSR